MELTSTKETVSEDLVERTPNGVEWCIFGSTDSVLKGLDRSPLERRMSPDVPRSAQVLTGDAVADTVVDTDDG